jgi:hypothetical protein
LSDKISFEFMEDPEVPTEHLHEHINEQAGEARDPWSMYLAISTALMAVFAALGSLFAGHHSNEALIAQIKASDQWSYYQAKGIKYEITHSAIQNTQGTGTDSAAMAQLNDKQAKYKGEQQDIMEKAHEAEKDSEEHLQKHVILARCVTLFQISIAISAISMLTRRRLLWYFSLVLSAGGLFLFITGMM